MCIDTGKSLQHSGVLLGDLVVLMLLVLLDPASPEKAKKTILALQKVFVSATQRVNPIVLHVSDTFLILK